MKQELVLKENAVVLFDGQNLYRAAKAAFSVTHPNYDPKLLAEQVCKDLNLNPHQIKFYTGIPDKKRGGRDLDWAYFWEQKSLTMTRKGLQVFTRSLRYRKDDVVCPDGHVFENSYAVEKGIDVRIAIDAVSAALNGHDHIIIFSQDQDLSEVAKEIKIIGKRTDRFIKIYSAFPENSSSGYTRGIEGTEWVKISKDVYEACVDKRQYTKPQRR